VATDSAVEILRGVHEALAQGDLDKLNELLDENVVWEAGGELPEPGTYRGREEVVRALRRQYARGPVALADLEEVDAEAEVAGFDFMPSMMGAPFGSMAVGRVPGPTAVGGQQCQDTALVAGVNQGRLTQFGSLTPGYSSY
jgi:hypothetical protein